MSKLIESIVEHIEDNDINQQSYKKKRDILTFYKCVTFLNPSNKLLKRQPEINECAILEDIIILIKIKFTYKEI